MTERIEGTAAGGHDGSGVELSKAAEAKAAEAKASETKADKSGQPSDRKSGTVSIRISTVVRGAVIGALVIAVQGKLVALPATAVVMVEPSPKLMPFVTTKSRSTIRLP